MKYAVNYKNACICHFAFSAKYVLRRIQFGSAVFYGELGKKLT